MLDDDRRKAVTSIRDRCHATTLRRSPTRSSVSVTLPSWQLKRGKIASSPPQPRSSSQTSGVCQESSAVPSSAASTTTLLSARAKSSAFSSQMMIAATSRRRCARTGASLAWARDARLAGRRPRRPTQAVSIGVVVRRETHSPRRRPYPPCPPCRMTAG
jgi:hypothetical protein